MRKTELKSLVDRSKMETSKGLEERFASNFQQKKKKDAILKSKKVSSIKTKSDLEG
jgi:hypothetical protein